MKRLDEIYEKIRKHPIDQNNIWLVGTAATLVIELTMLYKRVEELEESTLPKQPTLLEILSEEDYGGD